MTTASDFSVGLAHKFCVAAAEAGWTPAELNRLTQDMEALRRFRGLTMDKHVIDLDAPPYILSGWQFCKEDQLPNRLRGKLLWNPANLKLWLSESQQGGGVIKGCDLLAEIKRLNLPVYPAQVLDFLLAHPDQIPEELKGKYTCFWSPYRRLGGLYIRFLCWDEDGQWAWIWFRLGGGWDSSRPAAVSAS